MEKENVNAEQPVAVPEREEEDGMNDGGEEDIDGIEDEGGEADVESDEEEVGVRIDRPRRIVTLPVWSKDYVSEVSSDDEAGQ